MKKKQALSDTKMFTINDNGELFIEDKGRSNTEQLIGRLTLDTNEQKNAVNKILSLTEIKHLWSDSVKLSEPEKFIQTLLSKEQYKQQNGWEQEYEIKDELNNTKRRIDLACIVKDGDKNTVICGIENKHADYIPENDDQTHSNFTSQINSGFVQIKCYFDNLSPRNCKKNNTLIGAVYVYDGNYFFNNPNLINNITHYIYYNTPFFKTININYDPSFSYNHQVKEYMKEMTVEGTGLIDVLNVIVHNVIKEIKDRFVLVSPNELRTLNRESNPRSEEISKSAVLASNMVNNMINSLNSDLSYYATKYTNEKQISSLTGLAYMEKSKGKGGYLYGHSLSLSNGQHSNAAYFYIQELLEDINNSNYEESYFKNLKLDVERLKKVMKNKKISLNEFKKQLTLKAKITESHNREEEVALSISSNTIVSGVDTNISSIINFIHCINADLYRYGCKLQITIPRVQKMEGFEYIAYDIFPLLKDLSGSNKNILSTFRANGFKKIEEFKIYIFDLKNINIQIKKAKNDINIKELELIELNEDIQTLDSSRPSYKKAMDSIVELRSEISKAKDLIYRYSNFQMDVNCKKYNNILKQLILLSKIYTHVNSVIPNSKRKNNICKLAYGLISQSQNNDCELKKNFDFLDCFENKDSDPKKWKTAENKVSEIINSSVIYSAYINNEDLISLLGFDSSSVNKNSIFNTGKQGLSGEIVAELIDRVKNNDLENNNVNPSFTKFIKTLIINKFK